MKVPEMPIRVLLIAPSFDILGGQSVQASRIRQQMAHSEIDLQFLPINPRLPGPLAWLKRIKYIRTAANFFHFISLLLFRAPRADVLHVFSASYWSYTFWALPPLALGRLFGKKVILNYRDGQCADHLTNWRSALPTIRWAHAVVTPSRFLVDVFAQFGIQAQSISNFVEVSQFVYRRRRPLRPVFMTNRILEPLYNVPCILRAFRRIQDVYPEASLTIAHDGPLRASLEEMAASLKLANTRFLGRVPHDRIPGLYDEADIYLTTPDIDCMPGSLLECLCSGLPIVATRAGGIPYIVEHERTALLVPCDDDQAVADACFRLLNDPDLVERLTAEGLRAVSNHDPATSRSLWINLYRELLGRSVPSMAVLEEARKDQA
jgi:glycosyltransferase involved in cell wall biosynthesis